MNKINNKVVLVSGSGSGIGKATAKLFCENGARVILNGRDEQKLLKTQMEFETAGLAVDYCVADVTSIHDCAWLANYIEANYGALDVFVANASLSMNGRFENFSPTAFREILESNIYSVSTPLHYFLPQLKLTKGNFIIIGSVAGFYGLPTASAYCAGKSAVSVLQQSISAELSKYGVHVGIIHVGFAENDSTKKLSSGNGKWAAVPKRPKVIVQPKEKVAKEILDMVRRRTKIKTLSVTGNLTKFVSRFFPGLIGFIANINENKNKSF